MSQKYFSLQDIRLKFLGSPSNPLGFGLFRDLLEKVPWNKGPGGKRVQETWLLFKDQLLQAQEQSIQMTKKKCLHG